METAKTSVRKTSQKTTGAGSDFPGIWRKNCAGCSGNDVIDAYLGDKDVEQTDGLKILFEQLDYNIKKATALVERLYSKISEKQIALKAVHLKAVDITKFRALFIVEKSDFLSDNFREIYILARETKDEAESEEFYISFTFMPASESLSEDALIADAFFLKYEKK